MPIIADWKKARAAAAAMSRKSHALYVARKAKGGYEVSPVGPMIKRRKVAGGNPRKRRAKGFTARVIEAGRVARVKVRGVPAMARQFMRKLKRRRVHRNPVQGVIGTSPVVYLDRGSKLAFKGGTLRTGLEPRTFDVHMKAGTGYPGWMLGRPVLKIEYRNDAKALRFYKRVGPFRHVFKTRPTVTRIDRVGGGYVVTMSSRTPAWRKA
jgi:hypothetical protein